MGNSESATTDNEPQTQTDNEPQEPQTLLSNPKKISIYENREKTFKLQFASDIHLEFYKLNQNETEEQNKKEREDLFAKLLQPSAPYLALLGDIGLPASEVNGPTYENLLQWCGEKWEEVWVISGNHEYYKSNNIEVEERIQSACKKAGENVKYLQNTSFVKNGVRICGCSLWSEIPFKKGETLYNEVHFALSDYKHIKILDNENYRLLTPEDTHSWFENHIKWIKSEIDKVLPKYKMKMN